MSDRAFLAMRAGLIARELLTEDFSLTVAGCAHVDALIEELKVAEAPCDPDRERVRWNYHPQRRAA